MSTAEVAVSADLAVAEFLESQSIKYTAAHLGARKDAAGWDHDLWLCAFDRGLVVKRLELEFRTGTGHRKFPPGAVTPRPPYRPHTLAWEAWQKTRRAVAPAVASVLHSIQMDSSADDEPFGDWCNNFGYEEDSRKALEIYLACQKGAADYRRSFSHDERTKLAALLEDY